MCPLPPEPHFCLSPHPIPPGCHRALTLGTLHHTSDSHWLSILHMVMYMYFYSTLALLGPLFGWILNDSWWILFFNLQLLQCNFLKFICCFFIFIQFKKFSGFIYLFFLPRSILVPWPGIEPAFPAVGTGVLTAGPSGKSHRWPIDFWREIHFSIASSTVGWEKSKQGFVGVLFEPSWRVYFQSQLLLYLSSSTNSLSITEVCR